MRKRDVVFILGAGCSQEDGAPLVNDFFDVAFSDRIIYDLERYDSESIQELKTFRKEHLPNSNVEELFSFIDMQSKVKTINISDLELADIRGYLIRLINLTLKKSLENKKDTTSKKFIVKVKSIIESMDNPSLITFNWDLLLDNALIRHPSGGTYQLDYGVDFEVIEGRKKTAPCNRKGQIPLYKLHGSLNWIKCSCGRKYFKFQEKVGIDYVGKVRENFVCPYKKRKEKHDLSPMLVPPTFLKLSDASFDEIKKIWLWAKKDLIKAEKIIIIGYSLPDNDIPFKLYFRNALVENLNNENKVKGLKIDIVNYIPYTIDRGIFEDRYKQIIESVNKSVSSNRKIILNFIYKRFSDYIREDLANYGYTKLRESYS